MDAATPSPFSDYIVFVDESGDHSLAVINPDYPMFVLAFCILPLAAYIDQVTPAVRRLKCELFGHDMVILHEHDIRKKTGPFAQLNKERRDWLMTRLTETIAAAPMTLVAVVIDKVRHKARYTTPQHPYHLALKYGLERVHDFLTMQGQGERITTVVCEARGAKEDKEIELVSLQLPTVVIKVVCSKGTYIRSLARDIGEELKCGAYLIGLKRTRIGGYKVENAMTVDDFIEKLKHFETN